jgi:hypothetical protein
MRITKLPILLTLITFLFVFYAHSATNPTVNAQTPPSASTRVNSVNTIIQDMTGSSEARPHGVPASFGWGDNPRLSMGNNPGNFRAMMAWGQLYEAEQGNPATNTRVKFRNIRAYMLSKRDGKWYPLQYSRAVSGKAYREDFAGDANRPADVRYETDGTISAKAGGGFNFHFWSTSSRARIDPGDVAGMFTTLQAQLILDNPQGPDDRARARYVLSMGGDYWLDENAQWDNWRTNGDIGIGKFKLVTTRWRAFNMSTLSPAQLQSNPPPLE